MKQLFTTLFLVSAFTLNISIEGKPCNEFVDNVLDELKSDKDFFQEPYEIPDSVNSFGIYNIEHGYVYGLNTLHRLGDVTPLIKGETHLHIYLGAGEIKLQCSVKRKLLHIGSPITIDAKIPFVDMELEVVANSDDSSSQIVNFKINEVKGLTVDFSGLGIIRNFVRNAFVRLVGRYFKKLVRKGVEERLQNFLANKLKDFSIPSECLNDAWE